MAIIKPNRVFRVNTFIEFCIKFKINSDLIAGENGTDEELIKEQLSTYNKNLWLINFINDRNDGFFLLQEIVR
ncbi:hypothetical protein [Ichthyenterobacterium magnum]|uniref:Uncharacterized protein n=1 Tax=Ichthyenterobacterium magnum TaxID=1230530 RepID=A0A420DKT6_9FLAO|nr:hypothetical protein [Ichthyenterobacterium magnum]RKE94870.1 hypothetical protein BXY80_1883 [Ichthyenterobacterium magnum]